LSEAKDKISTKSAMRHFIFTLCPEFQPIQHNYCIQNLPSGWNWPTLLVLCRDFYNSVNPHGIMKNNSSSEGTIDRAVQHEKVKQWFLNPTKFCHEIESEHLCYPGKCIFHLSKSHPTQDCNSRRSVIK
jgi:hypothetical protein